MPSALKIIVLLLLLTTSWVCAAPLPDLGDPSQANVSSKAKREMEQRFLKTLHQQTTVMTDDILNEYISSLGKRLVQYSSKATKPFHFLLIQQDAVNAFAGPGGTVVINSALMESAEQESELAAVLAHEITHVTQLHLLRGADEMQRLFYPLLAGIAVAILTTQNAPALGNSMLVGGLAGLQQHMISFTRQHEQEADRIGMQILYRAGFNPASMIHFFQRLQRNERYYFNDLPDILRTHPVNSARIADAQHRLAEFKKKTYPDNDYFHFMQARVKVLSSEHLLETEQYFKSLLDIDPANTAARYGLALTYLQQEQAAQAKTILLSLKKKQANRLYDLSLARVYQLEHRDQKALSLLNNLLALDPDSIVLLSRYTNALLLAKKAEQAETLVEKALLRSARNPHIYLLLSRAQAANHKKAYAYFSRAQGFEILGLYTAAKEALRSAKRLTQKDKLLQSQIVALHKKIEQEKAY